MAANDAGLKRSRRDSEEPPPKRSRRTDSAAMWDKEEKKGRGDTRGGRDGRDKDHGGRRPPDRGPRDRSDRVPPGEGSSRRGHEKEERDTRDRRDGRDGRDRGDRRYRSRSRERTDRRKDRSKSRDRPPKRRSRSRSPRSPSRSNGTSSMKSSAPKEPKAKIGSKPVEDEMDLDEDELMKRMMGFGNFRSTKNTKVPGNNVYGVRKEKRTEYRQYMNRVGGFNRPLSPGR